MPVCKYCGDHANALKNHIRLSSGNGHGPSGQYPEDFAPDGDGADATGREAAVDPPPGGAYGRPGDTSDEGDESPQSPVAPDSTTETPTTDVHPDGSDDETQDATPDLKSHERPNDLDVADTDGCPECGSALVNAGGGTYRSVNGGPVPAGPVDMLCTECGLVIEPDGSKWPVVPKGDTDTPDSSGSTAAMVVGGVVAVGVAAYAALRGNRNSANGPETYP